MKSLLSEDELHEDEGNEEIDNAVHAASELLTRKINIHGSPDVIRQTLESLKSRPQQMRERASLMKDDFGEVEKALMEIEAQFPTRPVEDWYNFRSGNNPNLPYRITSHRHVLFNDCQYQVKNIIDLINGILNVNSLCSPESPMKDNLLQSQSEASQTPSSFSEKRFDVIGKFLSPSFEQFKTHFQIISGKETEAKKIFHHLKEVKKRIDYNDKDAFIIIQAHEPQSYVNELINYLEEAVIIPLKKRGIIPSIQACFYWKDANGNTRPFIKGTLKNHRANKTQNQITADLKDLKI